MRVVDLKSRNKLLTLSIFLNILLLVYFKYFNFFIENFNLLLNFIDVNAIKWTEVLLPIGISFITFHKLTYVIDSYRDTHRPIDSFSDYVLYIMMFPHQIAGPIVRYSEIADQINNRKTNETIDSKLSGLFRFVIGLSKKVLIANVLGNVANNIFWISFDNMSSLTAWIGILAYTFQIYFDFSGYSDMAIGLAKMMGFNFPENFNFPYISTNITEFWKRWHITLGRFMKDYLYIPLGGNKVSKTRLYINLWIVFLVSGVWHGAAWTFVIWGGYHGLLLIIDRIFFLKFSTEYFHKSISILITFFLIVIGWVFFRSPDIFYALDFIKKLFSFSKGNLIQPEFDLRFMFVFVVGILICLFPLFKIDIRNYIKFNPFIFLMVKGASLLILLIITVSEISASGFNPFIYFRF